MPVLSSHASSFLLWLIIMYMKGCSFFELIQGIDTIALLMRSGVRFTPPDFDMAEVSCKPQSSEDLRREVHLVTLIKSLPIVTK